MDNKAPSPVRVCDRFGPSCSFGSRVLHIPHLKIQIGQVKIGMEQRLRQRKRQGRLTYCCIGIYLNPNLKPIPTTDVNKLDIDKLHIEQDSPQEKQVKVTDSLILLPMSEEEKATMGETTEETTEGLTEVEKRYQLEEEKYALHQKVYVGQLSNEEESDTESDYSDYSPFD